jgi:hypothetical protein
MNDFFLTIKEIIKEGGKIPLTYLGPVGGTEPEAEPTD